MGAAAVLPPRAVLPLWEQAALRRLGTLCGALVGASVGLGGGVLVTALIVEALVAALWIVVAPMIALGVVSSADPVSGMPLWAAIALGAALVLGIAALVLGWLRLSHWPGGRAVGVTLAAAALAGIPAHGLNLAIAPLLILGDLGASGVDMQAVAVAATAGAGAASGAVAGRYAWAWMGHVMRPRWWRPEASARR